MEIRSITKEDLPMLVKVSSNQSLYNEDICFELSKVSFNEQGEILCFFIVRKRSLYDFFGGEFPLEIVDKDSPDYEEGEEYWTKEDVDMLADEHYELIYVYSKEGISDSDFRRGYCAVPEYTRVIWYDIKRQDIVSQMGPMHLYRFNDVVMLDIPYQD